MADAKKEIKQIASERSGDDRHVIIVSERSYDDMIDACEREEAPRQALVDAYLLYRQRVVSSER